MCKQILSLALSLVCSPSFAYALLAAGSQNRALSTHQSPASWSSGNLGGDDGGTSGPSCFRFTLPSACFGRPRFRNCPEAVPSRGLAPFGKIREDLGQCVGEETGGPGDRKNRFFSPRALWCVTTRTTTHTCSASTTPPSRRPTHQHQRNLSTFLYFSLLFPSFALCGTCWSSALLVGWFQWFSSHSGVFQSFVTIFSYFHAHIHSEHPEHTIKIIRGLVFRSFKSHTRDY
uniref:(northern house mosquito) hypothetical protein n=1 Tax=Culex pipiens TaxID=7175 RepID=A0A8D8D7W3_CULPI